MTKARLEAFTDGVFAILITILVLELKIPHGADLAALRPLLPVFLTYVLSFVYLGIYWNNHHHMLQATSRIDGAILWPNLHLLFWLSLVPFTTGWMGENHFAPLPTAIYGAVLLACAAAFTLLQNAIIRAEARGHGASIVARAVQRDWKGKLSMVLYLAAIPLAFVQEAIADALYVAVAAMWLVPDRRFERAVRRREAEGEREHAHGHD
jgi:TMEM175 potassium channel family protein